MDAKMLQNSQIRTSEFADLLILLDEVKRVVHILNGGKTRGVDNISAEVLKQGGFKMTKVLNSQFQCI